MCQAFGQRSIRAITKLTYQNMVGYLIWHTPSLVTSHQFNSEEATGVV